MDCYNIENILAKALKARKDLSNQVVNSYSILYLKKPQPQEIKLNAQDYTTSNRPKKIKKLDSEIINWNSCKNFFK